MKVKLKKSGRFRIRPHRPLAQAAVEDLDPLSGVANLFDAGMVFSVGLLLALVSYYHIPELMKNEQFTLVKNPGTPDMEIIVKKGQKLEKFRMSQEKSGGRGRKLGVAYQLENGEVVYVPEEPEQ